MGDDILVHVRRCTLAYPPNINYVCITTACIHAHRRIALRYVCVRECTQLASKTIEMRWHVGVLLLAHIYVVAP